jgi:VCBS repeat-containing protein
MSSDNNNSGNNNNNGNNNSGSSSASKTPAVNDAAGVAEGSSVTIDVMANDGTTARSIYSVNQDSSKQVTTDTTEKGATVSIVNGKIVYDSSTSLQFQSLAAGQTTTDTFTYVVKLADGKTDEASVTVRVTGTNDGPVLTPDIFGPHKLTEVAGVTGGTAVLKNAGRLLFGDIDLTDTHTVSSALASATASKGVIPVATQAALNAAFTTAMEIDSTRLPGGMVSYHLSLADKLVDFLGAGDTLKLVYNLTVSDGHGGTATQAVTYIVTGTADAIKVSSPVASPVEEGCVSTVDALTGVSDGDGGALSVVDIPATLPAGLTYNAATHSFAFATTRPTSTWPPARRRS